MKRKCFLFFAVTLVAALCIACGKTGVDEPAVTGTPAAGKDITPVGQPEGNDNTAGSPTPTPVAAETETPEPTGNIKDDPTPTPIALITNEPTAVPDDGQDTEPALTGTETDSKTGSDADENDKSETEPGQKQDASDKPENEDNQKNREDEPDEDEDEPSESELQEMARLAAWEDTFLIRVPEFPEGHFDGVEAEGTFDYGVFTEVVREDCLAYIMTLEELGFVHEPDTGDKNGRIWYYGTNDDNWAVRVDFEAGTMRIGSGFYEESEEESPVESLWSHTLLGNLPMPEFGTCNSYSDEGDFCYIVLEECTEDDLRNYVAALKKGGFTVDADEGDMDGMIWYLAQNEAGYSCDVTYYDSVARIECSM